MNALASRNVATNMHLLQEELHMFSLVLNAKVTTITPIAVHIFMKVVYYYISHCLLFFNP